MGIESDLIRFAHVLEERRNAAYDLWTWLPSYAAAERHHGDYGSNHTPDMGAIMEEAAHYLAALKNGEDMTAFWTEADGYYDGCPCGEPHGEATR